MITTLTKIATTEIQEIHTCLNFISTSTRLRPRLGAILYSSSAIGYEKLIAEDFIKFKYLDSNILFNSLLISAYGIFEKYIREISIASARIINAKYKNYDELRLKVKNQNIVLTGRALSSIFEPLDHYNLSYDELVNNIYTCSNGKTKFKINAPLFGLNHNILRPENINRIFERMDIEINWDELAKKGNYISIYGQLKPRELSNQIQSEIDTFVHNRNLISHNGPGVTNLDADYLPKLINFLILFVTSFSEFIKSVLDVYK